MWPELQQPVWWHRTRSLIVLAVIGTSVLTGHPHPSWRGAGLTATVLVVVCVAGRLPWIVRSPDRTLVSSAMAITGVASVALTFVAPQSAAIAFGAMATSSGMIIWTVPVAVAYTVGLAIAYSLGQLALDSSTTIVLIGPAAIGAGILIGVVRRQGNEIARAAELARAEHARSAALDERARIAREIHDVLAHSLAALSVQLETADALLESGRTGQAHASVLRAARLAREGMAETRQAISALRGDTLPLPELLAMLATEYRNDHAVPASVRLDGVPRPLPPDVTLALYRVAQESITNVRKHAPGAPVDMSLHYGSTEVRLVVSNGAGAGPDRPLATTGGGYGLTGLRERAELAGGTVAAGPDGSGWTVDVRIPS